MYVRKQLGYGFKLTPEEDVDSLINVKILNSGELPLSAFGDWLWEKYCPSHILEGLLDSPSLANDSVSDLLMFGDELANAFPDSLADVAQLTVNEITGESYFIISVPSYAKEWVRVNDPIDVAEFAAVPFEGNQYVFFKEKQDNHFPFSGYMNLITGRPLDEPDYKGLRIILGAHSQLPPEFLDAWCVKNLGFTVPRQEQVWDYLVPRIPVSVSDIIEWSGLFDTPNVTKRLRPAILVEANQTTNRM